MSVNLDLFGDPVPPGRGKRGRPAHFRTQETSNKFNLMAACGATLEQIALAFGITMPTLRKHYFYEIERYEAARFRLKAKLLAGLMTEADAGNVTAAKELFKQIERGEVARLPVAKSKKEKLGKKDQRLLEALEAGQDTEWSELLPN